MDDRAAEDRLRESIGAAEQAFGVFEDRGGGERQAITAALAMLQAIALGQLAVVEQLRASFGPRVALAEEESPSR